MDWLADPRLSGLGAIVTTITLLIWFASAVTKIVSANQGISHILHDLLWAPVAVIFSGIVVAIGLTLALRQGLNLSDILAWTTGLSVILLLPLAGFNFIDFFAKKEEKGQYRDATLITVYVTIIVLFGLGSKTVPVEDFVEFSIVAFLVAFSHVVLYDWLIDYFRNS